MKDFETEIKQREEKLKLAEIQEALEKSKRIAQGYKKSNLKKVKFTDENGQI